MTNYVPQKVLSDEKRFTQCCMSLIQSVIDNSVSGERNKINISCRFNSDKEKLYFEIEEYSKKVKPKDLEQLNQMLEAFKCPKISIENAENSTGRYSIITEEDYNQNKGLGLFVCQRILQHFGGCLKFKEDFGCKFSFFFRMRNESLKKKYHGDFEINKSEDIGGI